MWSLRFKSKPVPETPELRRARRLGDHYSSKLAHDRYLANLEPNLMVHDSMVILRERLLTGEFAAGSRVADAFLCAWRVPLPWSLAADA